MPHDTRTFLRRAALAALLLGAGAGEARPADAVSAADRAFVAKVSQGGMFEVALGTAAETQGSTQDIRDQGNTEAHDHTLVGDKLKAIAGEAGITPDGGLNAAFQAQLDRLKAMSGPGFDTAYLAAMEDIHAKDGAAFAAEAKGGTDPKLRAFAAETHRIVERHVGELRAVRTGQP